VIFRKRVQKYEIILNSQNFFVILLIKVCDNEAKCL
jgi:hypothetical protein